MSEFYECISHRYIQTTGKQLDGLSKQTLNAFEQLLE
jgi:hypothetical protein